MDRGAAAGEQQGQERERAAARHLGPAPVRQLDLDRAKDPEPRVHLGASLSRTGSGESDQKPSPDSASTTLRSRPMIELAPVLGLLAGAIGVADTVPYVRDTLRGSTRPHRGTWLIWGVLAIVVTLSQYADGASWSLIMASVQAVVTALIFALSIRHGEGGLTRDRAGDDRRGRRRGRRLGDRRRAARGDRVRGRRRLDRRRR